MDMNWTDSEMRPEPSRPIYNAAGYDTRRDPYCRRHSTPADSLWRLYESGTSMRVRCLRGRIPSNHGMLETGALRDFFNGSQSVSLTSYGNPMEAAADDTRSASSADDGTANAHGLSRFERLADDAMNGDDSPFEVCEIDHIWDENGMPKMREPPPRRQCGGRDTPGLSV